MDYGTEALSDTFLTLDGAGIAYMGAGETVERAAKLITVETNGYTLGFLAASRVYPSAQCDYLMVYLHWGVEKAERPEEYERCLAQVLIDRGADAVIGSHPHVLQGVEFYKGKPIFYSLGNFVFNASIGRTAFLRATVDFEAAVAESAEDLSDYIVWQMIPCRTVGYCTEGITDPDARLSFYEYMQSISYDVSYDTATGTVMDAGRGEG